MYGGIRTVCIKIDVGGEKINSKIGVGGKLANLPRCMYQNTTAVLTYFTEQVISTLCKCVPPPPPPPRIDLNGTALLSVESKKWCMGDILAAVCSQIFRQKLILNTQWAK